MEDVELVPEKEKIKDGKEGCPAFHCDLYDAEIVHKIAQLFLPGLAAACVDNTTGGIFKSPASVAVDLRKEMIDYVTQRSESFVAETIILEDGSSTEMSDHPYDIIADFVDDFASLKRNFFSRVSGWLLSEKREDNIDDFAQQMELNEFWSTGRRESIAQTLVKNVDFKNRFHCDKKFNTAEELAEHVTNCGFRSMNCRNEGCNTIFCASHEEAHDSICPFKIIPCEQKCSNSIMRREMDRHCITICPMKLVNCPFYAVGCKFTIPRHMVQKHCSDDLQLHLVYALKNIHKGASEEDLKQRVDQIVQSSSGQLDSTRDARSLTLRVRDLDAKLGPLEVNTPKKASEDSTEDADDVTEKSTDFGAKKDTEKSYNARDGALEKSTNSTNKDGEESTEDADNIADRSMEARAENKVIGISHDTRNGAGESTNVINVDDKSTEDAKDIADKSAESGAEVKVTDKSYYAGNDAEKSADTINKDSEESTEDRNNFAGKSKEAEAENKVIESSYEAGNDVQNTVNTTNMDCEESMETSDLTTSSPEERKAQLSTS